MNEPLYVTAASVDLTPTHPAPLFGYAGRHAAFERVVDPLELNGLLLRQGDHVLLLGSADLLYVTDDWEAMALDLLRARWPGALSAAVFAASHNHFAPAADPTKPVLGRIDSRYASFVETQVRALVTALLDAPATAATISYRRGEAAHAVNRRRPGWEVGRRGIHRTMASLPNLQGPKDESLHAITLRDDRGPRAVVWSYACHPTGFPDRNSVSAEFPGAVRRAVRERLGNPALPVLFLQGFSGNIRPPAFDRSRRPVSLVRRMLNGTAFGAFTREEYRSWSTSLAERVVALSPGDDLSPALDHASVEFPLGDILPGAPSQKNVRLTTWTLAPTLRMVGFSAEMMSEAGPGLRAHFPEAHLVPVTCLGSVFGYLPTRAMLDEGGYEAGGYFPVFGLRGRFSANVEERVDRALQTLARGPTARALRR